jgi:hypothetical protein
MLLAAMLLLGAGINSAFAQSVCVCTGGSCGNNAVGGDSGDIFSKVSPESVKGSFQTSSSTGWTCFTPAKVRGAGGPLGCFCKGSCGNGGIGADPNYVDLGITQAIVDKSYGGGKPGNKTGWLCGKSRGDFTPPKAPDPKVPDPKIAACVNSLNPFFASIVKLHNDGVKAGQVTKEEEAAFRKMEAQRGEDAKAKGKDGWTLAECESHMKLLVAEKETVAKMVARPAPPKGASGQQRLTFASSIPASLAVGGTVTLAATSSAGPGAVFTFGSSSAPTICKVSGTTVTAVGVGLCGLTAKATAANFATTEVSQNLQITPRK